VILTPAQNVIAGDTHRFRVLNCGRRFGKTSLSIEEIKGKAIGKPSRIAYIAPTVQQARDIAWEQLKRELRPAATYINESRLEIRVRTVDGGESLIVLRGWEAVETLRGQQFDFLVLDEVASMRNFWLNWREVLRPTLTDTEGEALFISTPKGFNHFYDLYNLQEENAAYKSFHYTSYDNPHIKKEEIDAAKGDSNFEQEYLADFRKAEGLVYKEFDRAKHVYSTLPEGTGFVESVVGIDWGFVHPAAVLLLKRDRTDAIWVDSEFVERGRTDAEVAEYAAALNANAYYPDPESANANEELRRRGVNVRPVVKGKDSEKNGIDKVRELLKANKLHINKACKNLIAEFETHGYKEGRDEPEDEGEDALDALRYPVMMMQPAPKTIEQEYVEPEPLYSDIGL
jgi:hypothetical protein